MRPVRRSHVKKSKSSRAFKRNVSRTKAANMKTTPMRGGFRF